MIVRKLRVSSATESTSTDCFTQRYPMPLWLERTAILDVALGRRSSRVRRLPGKDFDFVKPREILAVVRIDALYTILDHHGNYKSIEYRLWRYLVSWIQLPSTAVKGAFVEKNTS